MGKHKLGFINETVKEIIGEMHGVSRNTSYYVRKRKCESEAEKRIKLVTCGLMHMYANRMERAMTRLMKQICDLSANAYVRGMINDKDEALYKISKICKKEIGYGR